MTTYVSRLITAAMLCLGLTTSSATAQTAARSPDVPAVPPGLEVPAGHRPYLLGHASGTQNYVCLPTPTGAGWKFIAPQATLYQRLLGDLYQQITTHFLSANPFEPGVARPSWQHSFDSSQVWGRAAATSTDPAYVEAGAIPWLLVEIVGAERGSLGGDTLTSTTYIHRVNTSGGVAPGPTCSEIGALALVPYTTDYVFYRAQRKR